MNWIELAAGPVVGAVIGYITNDIAIRMLFRPYRAKYLFGHRIPFTPGIVPRRKNQLASLLGKAIVEKLFNADDLEIVFTDGIGDAVADELLKLLRSSATPASVKSDFTDAAVEKMEQELCVRIQAAICTSDLPELLAAEGVDLAVKATGDSAAGHALAASLGSTVAQNMGHEIREFIIENGYELILPLVKKELERAASMPISELTGVLLGGEDAALHAALKDIYLRFMAIHVRPIVESIDVGGMIEEKIMTAEEVEDIVLSVVRRELKLVVLFGALVGAVIGAINIFL